MGDIHHILAELAAHGYLVFFGWTAAEALGAPLPAAPILLAAGILTATGRLSFCVLWAFGLLACFIGDVLWYGIGGRWVHAFSAGLAGFQLGRKPIVGEPRISFPAMAAAQC